MRVLRCSSPLLLANIYPAMPLDSILLASSTSREYTSNCHCLWPRMPARTAPVWIPTRMSTGELVFCCTYLKRVGWGEENKKCYKLANKDNPYFPSLALFSFLNKGDHPTKSVNTYLMAFTMESPM